MVHSLAMHSAFGGSWLVSADGSLVDIFVLIEIGNCMGAGFSGAAEDVYIARVDTSVGVLLLVIVAGMDVKVGTDITGTAAADTDTAATTDLSPA